MINEIQAKITFQNIVQCPFNLSLQLNEVLLMFVILLATYPKYVASNMRNAVVSRPGISRLKFKKIWKRNGEFWSTFGPKSGR